MTRRECLAALASAALFPRGGVARPLAAPAPAKPMRGAFMIMATPYTASGDVDWDDLARELAFIDACGAQGAVWPQGSSGVATLTKQERLHGLEVLAAAARGKRVALVLGVQGKDTAEMLEYAARAEQLEPDAMIAMPPSTGRSMDDYRSYFRALGRATKRPVIVQTTGGARDLPPTVDLIVELASEFPHLGYVKEESAPVVARMEAELQHRPPLRGIFGAAFGAGWLYEMRLGLDGVITGNAMYADLMARMWELHEQRRPDELRAAFSAFLLMRNLAQQIPSADLYIMKKRGVFKTMATRGRSNETLSPDAVAEIEYRFSALKPYLRAPGFTS